MFFFHEFASDDPRYDDKMPSARGGIQGYFGVVTWISSPNLSLLLQHFSILSLTVLGSHVVLCLLRADVGRKLALPAQDSGLHITGTFDTRGSSEIAGCQENLFGALIRCVNPSS